MSGIKILLVDDEESVLTLLERTMKREGHDVLLATNGEQALEMVKIHSPACVVADLVMPVMDGMILLKQMREQGFNMPFIFFSAYGTDKNRMLALEYDAYDFINKDKIGDIIKAVNEVINDRLFKKTKAG